MKTRFVWLLALAMAMVLVSLEATAEPIKVLVFTDSTAYNEENDVLNAIPGITAIETQNTGDISAANLANYDVLYAASCFGTLLDSKATIIRDYIHSGHGVVVGQSNVKGAIDWLPSTLSVNVADIYYPQSGSFSLTAAGQSHPIFEGRTASALGGGVADTIYASGLGSGWTVLANFTSGSSVLVGMAAGTYGEGRVLLWPGRYEADAFANPTSAMIGQAYHGTAVPEPSTIVLAGMSVISLLVCGRRRLNHARCEH